MRYVVVFSGSTSEPGNLAAEAIAREINRVLKYREQDTGTPATQAEAMAELTRALTPAVIAKWGMVVQAEA